MHRSKPVCPSSIPTMSISTTISKTRSVTSLSMRRKIGRRRPAGKWDLRISNKIPWQGFRHLAFSAHGERDHCCFSRSERKREEPCAGYFLRYVAYFYRFYVFYTKYHPLLCLAEASRLGHPFRNSPLAPVRFSFSFTSLW